jgi:hypothetical protein
MPFQRAGLTKVGAACRAVPGTACQFRSTARAVVLIIKAQCTFPPLRPTGPQFVFPGQRPGKTNHKNLTKPQRGALQPRSSPICTQPAYRMTQNPQYFVLGTQYSSNHRRTALPGCHLSLPSTPHPPTESRPLTPSGPDTTKDVVSPTGMPHESRCGLPGRTWNCRPIPIHRASRSAHNQSAMHLPTSQAHRAAIRQPMTTPWKKEPQQTHLAPTGRARYRPCHLSSQSPSGSPSLMSHSIQPSRSLRCRS